MRSPFAPALALVLATSLALAACGGGQAEPTTPGAAAPSAETAPPAGAPSGGAVWSDAMSKDEKVAFMKTHVAPRMTKVFQAADAKRYAEFGCKTCHGPKNQEPRDFLPHLEQRDGKLTAFAEKPQVAKWMAEVVVPEMAAAMGRKPYDPETHQGFGCAGCHRLDAK